MIRKSLYIFSSLLIALAFSYCRKDVGKSILGNYPNEIGKIIIYKCATSGCHNDASYMACDGLNLSSWENLFKGSNSGSPVIPYSSKFSSLCYFINTYPDLGIINKPTMPFTSAPLSRDEVTLIKNWIDAGAPDVNGFVKWSDNPNRKKIYVTNQGCDVVTVFDSETMLPIRFVEVGNNPGIEVPHMVKVSPDGKYWYVVFVNNNILQKFRCSDDVLVGTAYLGANFDWNTLTITKDSKKAFCVAWTSNGHIASVDLDQMKLIRNYGGFVFPHGAALTAANDTLYVTAQTGNFLYKLDTAFAITPVQVSLDGLPPSTTSSLDAHEIILSPDSTTFYITCQKINKICWFDIGTNTTITNIATGVYPQEMVISKAKNKMYISCPYDSVTFLGNYGCVYEMNLLNNTMTPIRVGSMPHGIGVDETKNTLYVASRNILSNGPAPHHTGVCAGRNGFVQTVNMSTHQVSTKRTEISIDPYSVNVRN